MTAKVRALAPIRWRAIIQVGPWLSSTAPTTSSNTASPPPSRVYPPSRAHRPGRDIDDQLTEVALAFDLRDPNYMPLVHGTLDQMFLALGERDSQTPTDRQHLLGNNRDTNLPLHHQAWANGATLDQQLALGTSHTGAPRSIGP